MKPKTIPELRAALRRFVDGHFHYVGKEPPRISVPANHEHDDDLALSLALYELEALRRENDRRRSAITHALNALSVNDARRAYDVLTDTTIDRKSALRAAEKAPEARRGAEYGNACEGHGCPVHAGGEPEAREPARLDADGTAKPRTVLVAHATVKPGAMVAHDNEIERYELRDTREPAAECVGICPICSTEIARGSTVAGYGSGDGNRFAHIECYRAKHPATPAADGLTAEELRRAKIVIEYARKAKDGRPSALKFLRDALLNYDHRAAAEKAGGKNG